MPDKSSMPTQIQKQIEEAVVPDRFRTIQTWNGEIFQWVIAYLKKPTETNSEVIPVALEMMERIEPIIEKHLSTIATKSAEEMVEKINTMIGTENGNQDYMKGFVGCAETIKEMLKNRFCDRCGGIGIKRKPGSDEFGRCIFCRPVYKEEQQ